MTLEMIPLVIGGLLGLVGLGLVADAWASDNVVAEERRKRTRRERSRFGEGLVGLGVIAMAAALIGRDTWRYTTLSVIAGAVLLLLGSFKNSAYIREIFVRGDRAKLMEGSRRIR
jgi:hypothetical protein